MGSRANPDIKATSQIGYGCHALYVTPFLVKENKILQFLEPSLPRILSVNRIKNSGFFSLQVWLYI